MISLICSQDGNVPLRAQTIAGNISDKVQFQAILKTLKNQIKESDEPVYYIGDNALYTAETIKEVSNSIK